MGTLSRREDSNLVKDALLQVVARKSIGFLEDRGEAALAEEFGSPVHGFGDTVGEEQERVAVDEGDLEFLDDRLERITRVEAERQSRRL